MRFKDYIDSTGCSLVSIQKLSGVSYTLIKEVYGGHILQRFDKAKAVSAACEGQVSIEELCTAAPQVAKIARSRAGKKKKAKGGPGKKRAAVRR